MKNLSICIMLSLSIPSSLQAAWYEYRISTLSSIVDAHQSEMEGVDFAISAARFPLRAMVVYTGKVRKIKKDHKQLITWWAKSTGQSNNLKLAETFKKEALYKEGATSYWIPTQESLIVAMKKEGAAGSIIQIYTAWLGAFKGAPIFIVNEFAKSGVFNALVEDSYYQGKGSDICEILGPRALKDNGKIISNEEWERAMGFLKKEYPKKAFRDFWPYLNQKRDDKITLHHEFGMQIRNSLRKSGFAWGSISLDENWGVLMANISRELMCKKITGGQK